jgi:two-component system CheB/CheR fusion protein
MTPRKRVLIVDHWSDWVSSLALLLQHEGHAVCTATNGHDALCVAAQFRPDVALLELRLPDVSGLELGQRLRDQFGDACRLIAISCSSHCPESVMNGAAGFAAHLFKPVRVAAVLALIER